MSGANQSADENIGRAIDRPMAILAMILVGTVTEAMLLLLPLFIGAIADLLALNARQIGILGSADLAGLAIGASSAVWWLRKVPWRAVVLASLALFGLSNLASLEIVDFTILAVLRLVAGLAAGCGYAVALAGLCDTRNEARNTALMICGQVVFGAIGFYLLPMLPEPMRLSGIFYFINGWILISFVLAWFCFPANVHRAESHAAPLPWGRFGLGGLSAFLGTGLYFLAIGAVWGYLERIAMETGLALEEVGASLSLGYVISLLGSVAAAWLGVRFGRAVPMLVTGGVQIAMLFVFTRMFGVSDPGMVFFLANAVFQFFWSYIVSYQMVIFAEADRDRRFMPLYGTAVHVALAIGPFAGAFLIDEGSYRPVLWFGIAVLAACYASFLASIHLTRKAHRA